MKRHVIVTAMALTLSTGAYASKARLEALQNARFLKDVQTTFINPAHINSLGQMLTVEFGAGANTSNPKAEGGLFANAFGGNSGIYLGHVSELQQSLRTTGGYENQNNPIDLFFGRDSWGASIGVSNHNDKTTDVKESSLTLRFGYDKNGLEVYGTVEALQKAEQPNNKYTGGPQVSLGVEKEMGKNYVFGGFHWGTAESKPSVGNKVDVDVLGLEAGVINRSLENIYYGVSLDYAKVKVGQAATALTLPIFVGIEANVTSWAVVRASIQQSVLISQTQDKNAAAPANRKITNKNDTTVAAGLGIKYNKFTLDGVLSASTTGDVNGNAVLSQASLSYSF